MPLFKWGVIHHRVRGMLLPIIARSGNNQLTQGDVLHSYYCHVCLQAKKTNLALHLLVLLRLRHEKNKWFCCERGSVVCSHCSPRREKDDKKMSTAHQIDSLDELKILYSFFHLHSDEINCPHRTCYTLSHGWLVVWWCRWKWITWSLHLTQESLAAVTQIAGKRFNEYSRKWSLLLYIPVGGAGSLSLFVSDARSLWFHVETHNECTLKVGLVNATTSLHSIATDIFLLAYVLFTFSSLHLTSVLSANDHLLEGVHFISSLSPSSSSHI